MGRTYLLWVTALAEGATGLALLAVPSLVLGLLLGVADPAPEALVVGRVLGGALAAVAIFCGAAATDGGRGPVVAVLVYDCSAAVALALAAASLGMAGALLWPAVAVHAILAGWCAAYILRGGTGRPTGRPTEVADE